MRASIVPAFDELDLRGVEPPGHVLALLKKVSQIPPGESLHARLDNHPAQLYDLLQQRGFLLQMEPAADGGYAATIRPQPTPPVPH